MAKLSAKQIRYLWAVGALTPIGKGFSSRTDVRSSIGLSGTKRQYMRAVGRVGADLAVGEISKTHQVKIGDKLYPIKKDRNLSSYPVGEDGKMFGVSGWPEGEVSIVRISSLNAKKLEKGSGEKSDANKSGANTRTFENGDQITAEFADKVRKSEFVNPQMYRQHFAHDKEWDRMHDWGLGFDSAAEDLIRIRDKVKENRPYVSAYDVKKQGLARDGEDPIEAAKRIQEEKFAEYESKYQLRAKAKALVNEALQNKDRLESELQTMVDSHDLLTRMTVKGLQGVLNAGRFKTQFETKRSKGYYDPSIRATTEEALFGLDKDSDPVQRPIYGYVGKRDGSTEIDGDDLVAYGDVIVSFKNEVRDRTTITDGDSMDRNGQGRLATHVPTPIKSLDITAMGPSALIAMHAGAREYVGQGEYEIFRPTKPSDVVGGSGYMEAQIHRGVKSTDISHVTFRTQAPPPDSLLKKLEKLGITFQILPYQYPPEKD